MLSEGDAAMLDIRAGHIDLKQIDRLVRELLDHLHIVRHCPPADIDDNPRVKLFQKRKVPLNQYINAGILQPDRIEHSPIRLLHARSGVPLPRHIRNPFCHDGAEAVQINEACIGIFHTRAKSS